MGGMIEDWLGGLSREDVERFVAEVEAGAVNGMKGPWPAEKAAEVARAFLGLADQTLRLVAAGDDLATVVEEAVAGDPFPVARGSAALRAWESFTQKF